MADREAALGRPGAPTAPPPPPFRRGSGSPPPDYILQKHFIFGQSPLKVAAQTPPPLGPQLPAACSRARRLPTFPRSAARSSALPPGSQSGVAGPLSAEPRERSAPAEGTPQDIPSRRAAPLRAGGAPPAPRSPPPRSCPWCPPGRPRSAAPGLRRAPCAGPGPAPPSRPPPPQPLRRSIASEPGGSPQPLSAHPFAPGGGGGSSSSNNALQPRARGRLVPNRRGRETGRGGAGAEPRPQLGQRPPERSPGPARSHGSLCSIARFETQSRRQAGVPDKVRASLKNVYLQAFVVCSRILFKFVAILCTGSEAGVLCIERISQQPWCVPAEKCGSNSLRATYLGAQWVPLGDTFCTSPQSWWEIFIYENTYFYLQEVPCRKG